MSTVTKCTCGHEISQHTYSEDFTGCDVSGCNCMLDLGELIDKYQIEVTDRTEQNLKDVNEIAQLKADRENAYKEIRDMNIPMPCGHLARYAVNVDEGTQYCVMCVCESNKQTIANLVLNDVEDTDEKCPFCRTRAILKRVEQLLDFVPEINSDHYDSVIANLSNDTTSAHSYFMCYCEDDHAK